MATRWLCFLLILTANVGFADEQVRQAQEELRKRNLYFGDIDGQLTPDVANALKRYQSRKGFAVTGSIDEETATSLNVEVRSTVASIQAPLPDVPVLRSDNARELPAAQRVALEIQAEENPDLVPTPEPPGESPPPAQDLSRERVTKLVEQYLQDGETSDIPAQTRYFAYPLAYFDHGTVDRKFVDKDVANYVKRWPERNYTLIKPVTFTAAENEGDTNVEFEIQFNVRSKKHAARGRTKNFWMIRPQGEDLKIISVREERLRE